jgi:uncharacterized SAM-binding protein YcdF (DUF218 family)
MTQVAFLCKKIISYLLLPPSSPIILGLIGLILIRKRPGLAKALIGFSLVITLALSTSIVSTNLVATLQVWPIFNFTSAPKAGAIVVLGGGARLRALEYGGRDELLTYSLERVRYAAYLHRKTGLPILVTGGRPFDRGSAEGQIMANVLQEEYGIPVKWIEDQSKGTAENAILSAAMLSKDHIKQIVLVTHTWHMRRAMLEFQGTDLDCVPAPINFIRTDGETHVMSFMPTAASYLESSLFMREWLGIGWARMRAIIK